MVVGNSDVAAEPLSPSSADRFISLFEHMQEGVALHELVYDADGQAVDYRVIDANLQFELHTGLLRSRIIGRLATEAYNTSHPPYFEHFAAVALGGEARRFETYFAPLDRHFSISVAPLGPGAFATIFSDITEQKRAEQALERSERKFRQVFDFAPDPLVVTSQTGQTLFVNRAFCETTGYSAEELLGRTTEPLWVTLDIRKELFERIRHDGHVENLEFKAINKAGELRHVVLSGAQIELDGIKAVITGTRDLTEIYSARAAAEVAREELDQYFMLSLDLLCIAGMDGIPIRINPAWTRVLGYPVSQLLHTRLLSLVHPDDIVRTRAAVAGLTHGQAITDLRNRYRHADGSYRWLEWHAAPGPGGLIYGLARDVTERQAFEQALQDAERAAARSREDMLSVAELAHIGHFVIDFAANIVKWTPEYYRIMGLEPSVEATIERGRACIHPDDFERVEAAIQKALATHSASRFNNRVVRPTGEIRECLTTVEGDFDNQGRARVLGLVQDITESKRAEEEQRKLEQKVMQSQKLESLGILAGGIAHDFNNLLTSILGNADLALSDLSPVSPVRPYLEDIEQVCRRAADLCRQMLAYSGKGRFVVQPVSLNDIVQEMAYLLGVSISKKVVIKYNFFANLPCMMADATQIRQVVMNLITNASEAIGELSGVVTLTTGVMDCDDEYLSGAVGHQELHPTGQYVYVEVSDTGCGMDSETIERIFDPFFTTKFTGRGLGLAAVMGIVRGHKGALRVYSERGRGTTFKVLFPAHEESAQAQELAAPQKRTWRASGLVLLADDEESIRSMGRRMLEKAGFDVITAEDGREAVALYRQHLGQVRLVILDMTMPHLDGEACFRELRRISPHVKVVMTSGYNEQDVVNRFVGKGLAGFVQKPYKAADLLPKLLTVLGED